MKFFNKFAIEDRELLGGGLAAAGGTGLYVTHGNYEKALSRKGKKITNLEAYKAKRVQGLKNLNEGLDALKQRVAPADLTKNTLFKRYNNAIDETTKNIAKTDKIISRQRGMLRNAKGKMIIPALLTAGGISLLSMGGSKLNGQENFDF